MSEPAICPWPDADELGPLAVKTCRRLPLDDHQCDVAYFEPRMRDRGGHFAVLADHYAHLCRRLGLSVATFHNSGWRGEQPENWHRLFALTDHRVGAPEDVDERFLDAYGHYLAAVLEHALRRTGARVAIFPTARFLTLPGLARAAANADRLRGLVVGVMETAPVPDCGDQRLVAGAFRTAARMLAESGKDFMVLAESQAIGDWLVDQGFGADQLRIAPFPAAARFADRPRPPRRDARLRCGAFGATRPVQNPGLLAAFLRSTDQAGRDWTVRLDMRQAARQLGEAPEPLAAALEAKGIRQLPLRLSQADYDDALSGQDVLLMPYGERYDMQGSGMFLEALCAGVIPLVPAGSSMHRLYRELGGLAPVMQNRDVEGLGSCLAECEERITELRGNAVELRGAWLDHHHGPRQWASRIGAFVCRQTDGAATRSKKRL